MIIEESGIVFGEFDNEKVFWIEQSAVYKRYSGSKIRSVEFMLKREPNELWFIEAKSGAPKMSKQDDCDRFITVIFEKMSHSFSLLVSVMLNRNTDEQAELSNGFRMIDWAVVNVKFVLVINWDQSYPDAWLNPLRDALQRKFAERIPASLKIWRIRPELSVAVINYRMAAKYGLIKGNI